MKVICEHGLVYVSGGNAADTVNNSVIPESVQEAAQAQARACFSQVTAYGGWGAAVGGAVGAVAAGVAAFSLNPTLTVQGIKAGTALGTPLGSAAGAAIGANVGVCAK